MTSEQETSFAVASTSSENQNIASTKRDSSAVESELYSDNQLGFTSPQVVVRTASTSSSNDDWPAVQTTDERQGPVMQIAPSSLQTPGENGPTFINNLSDNEGVKLTTSNTQNIYIQCCSSTLFDEIGCTKHCIARWIVLLLGMLIFILISMWLSNIRITTQFNSSNPYNSTSTDEQSQTTTPKIVSSSALPIILTTMKSTNLDSINLKSPSSTTSDVTTSLETFTVSSRDTNDITSNNALKVVSRDGWEAITPKEPPKSLTVIPPIFVIISETETESCTETKNCTKLVRSIQISQMVHSWHTEICYNFLIGGDGMVYEGRGWDVMGEQSYMYDNRSISISFIGSFDTDEPTESQLQAANSLIDFGVRMGKVSVNYKLKAFRDMVYFSSNPGTNLYKIIKTWKNWDPKWRP